MKRANKSRMPAKRSKHTTGDEQTPQRGGEQKKPYVASRSQTPFPTQTFVHARITNRPGSRKQKAESRKQKAESRKQETESPASARQGDNP
ncbi:hypothetical protein [Paraburkholderia caribensis]|uniref:hypothetical protein n=1 Tax=Paraburkholderia caribensis TaxID=75105 RepID=UPI0031D5AA84